VVKAVRKRVSGFITSQGKEQIKKTLTPFNRGF